MKRAINRAGRTTAFQRGRPRKSSLGGISDIERDRHRRAERDTGHQRQPSDSHERGDADCEIGRSSRLQGGERHPGCAHRRDHRGLLAIAALREALTNRDREHADERAQRERHCETFAVQPGSRTAVGCTHGDQHAREPADAAIATPSLPARTCVAKPLTRPSASPTVASTRPGTGQAAAGSLLVVAHSAANTAGARIASAECGRRQL